MTPQPKGSSPKRQGGNSERLRVQNRWSKACNEMLVRNLTRDGLTVEQWAVALVLLMDIGTPERVSRITYNEIAERTPVRDKRTIREALMRLDELGYLDVQGNTRGRTYGFGHQAHIAFALALKPSSAKPPKRHW